MWKEIPAMNGRIRLRDVLRAAVTFLEQRSPGYQVVEFFEATDPDTLRGRPAWSCDCCGDFPVGWHFVLEKEDPAGPGPARLAIALNPVDQVVFAGRREDILFGMHAEAEPLTLRLRGAEARLLDAELIYWLDWPVEGALDGPPGARGPGAHRPRRRRRS
jgi:hypothetical protein